MQAEGFFEGLGQVLGRIIRFVVDMLSGTLGAIGDALDAFFRGLAGAIGMSPSIFSFILLAVGLLFLLNAVRALLRRSIFAAIVWLLLGLIVMGWLIR